MRLTIRAHFDGRAIIPDEPLHLPAGQPLTVDVRPAEPGPGDHPTIAERDAAIDRLLSRPITGLNIPDWALRREHLYED